MQACAGLRTLWASAVLFMSLLSCGPASSTPSDYAHAYKALMENYRTRMQALTARPLPPKSAPKEQKRVAVVQQVEDVANAYTRFALQLAALKPPVKFHEVHTTTLSWLQIEAADNHRWAEAIRHDNRQARNRVFQDNQAHELKAVLRMQQALQRAGGVSPELQAFIDELRQNIKTP